MREGFNRFALHNRRNEGENARMQIVTCPNCGAKNRVDETRSDTPICGQCKKELPKPTDSAMPASLTDATFAGALADAGDRPILVDCWAPWCRPCVLLTPIVEQLARESAGRWVIAKLNTDVNQQTAAQYKISAIPTLLIFKKGNLVDRITGVHPKADIAARINAQL
jgi:thioredoxin